RLYRYYVDHALLKGHVSTSPAARLPAAEIEAAVVGQLRQLIRSPEMVVRVWRAVREDSTETDAVTETEVRDALLRFDDLWAELFPAEQAQIVQLLVAQVRVDDTGLSLTLRTDGLAKLWREVSGARDTAGERSAA